MKSIERMIYHIVPEKEYRQRSADDRYVPAHFDEIGFVHCALETSVLPVADDYYANVENNLLLLQIDPAKLQSTTKYEAAAPEKGAGTRHLDSSPVFPHVYGPIENSAVAGIGVLRQGKNGYVWPQEFIPLAEYLNGNRNHMGM